jgi:hypothetical protein
MAVMPSVETTALLAEAEPLPYPQRMALLAARARAWTGTPVLDIVLADLSADRRHRDTALFLAIVGRRGVPVRAALADPDPSVQCRALDAWIRNGLADAGELAEFLVDAPARARRVAYRSLRQHRSPGIADALIDRVRERFGDEEAGRLLPVCSSQTVARLLPEVGHTLGSWSLLGARHPAVVLAEAARQLASLKPPGRAIWWAYFGSGVLAAVPAVPEAVLDLLERYGPPANLVPAENYVQAGQAACSYSWRRPPRRSRRWMFSWVSRPGSVIGSGSGLSGAALAMPWWGRCAL